MIAEIILKKLSGQLNREEEILFKKWLYDNDENFLTYERLEELHHAHKLLPDIDELDPNEAWKIITNSLEQNRPNKRKPIYNKSLLRYAAVFIGLGGLFFLFRSFNNEVATSIEIDSNAITLELGNGEVQILSQKGAAKILTNKGDLLGNKGNGIIDYSQNEISENDVGALEYNTIHIPNGKTFEIILSDGTVVNLNAGSSLKYPVKFIKGKNRQVSLTGEAFFDVRKNEHSPFIVASGTMAVRVLGTKFNVSSYPEDTYQSTVLVEGSVRLYETGVDYDANNSTLLSPGYKADWNASDKKMMVNKVNTELYTGWIEGKLVMKKMNFSNIIQRLQRRYDVKIINEYKELDERIFTATFETETIREVLETFKVETPFEYEIKGDEIRIYNN
ncbi:FecR family protein [Maribacter sp. X9]|uniref:FecR family protein n=1 Tax=Maribacter sp. X9 TaxID=3402159 RepID=UPI003AF3B647